MYHAIYCRVFGFLVFQAVLLFGPDLLPGWLMRSEEVFLDKVCIHQVDLALQRQGIESLGGFLFYSWSMAVLYTGTCTKKLWTVYEMACFLCLHPGGRLEWLPVDLPPAVYVGSLLAWLNGMLFGLLTVASARKVFAVPRWILPVSAVTATLVTFVFRKMARDQTMSAADLRHFSIQNAHCAVESDRVVVECNVASLMRDLKLVPADSTRENALAVFDLMVQDTLPRAIRDSMGRVGVRYEHLVIIQAVYIFGVFDIVGGFVFAGSNVQLVVAAILSQITLVYMCVPLLFACMMHFSGYCLHLSGWKGVAFVLLIATASLLVYGSVLRALEILVSAAKDDVFALVIFCLLSAALFCLTCFVYRRPRGTQRRRRTGTTSETLEQLAEALASHHQLGRGGSEFVAWVGMLRG